MDKLTCLCLGVAAGIMVSQCVQKKKLKECCRQEKLRCEQYKRDCVLIPFNYKTKKCLK